MLVTDPRIRAPLAEIMHHPWMTKGANAPPENHVPLREPLQLPLDDQVIDKMHGFDFGSPDYIKRQLQGVLSSDDYQRAVKLTSRRPHVVAEAERKKSVFDFYQRRKSANSKDTLTTPSSEALHLGEDPVNAFSPLISIYYLAREKQEREKREANPGALAMPQSPGHKPLHLQDLSPPEPALTNSAAFEMKGEPTTGGRSRPRARTHGEDELGPTGRNASQQTAVLPADATPTKKESTAIGLIRRFSTRRGRDSTRHSDKEKELVQQNIPSTVASAASSTREISLPPPRNSFSVRKTRDTPPSAYKSVASNHPDLLGSSDPSAGTTSRLRGLGRSTSVNSGDLRRKWSTRRSTSERPENSVDLEKSKRSDPKAVNGDASSEEGRGPSVLSARARSTGHTRRGSVAKRTSHLGNLDPEVPEETDQELAEDAEYESGGFTRPNPSQETMKPVYLKGLFSVSTTSSKPLNFIRSDIIRVLKQLGVEYREIKGGFTCRHVPSIDLNKVVDNPPLSDDRAARQSFQHRRKISFVGVRGTADEKDVPSNDLSMSPSSSSRPPATPRGTPRRLIPDSNYTTEEEISDEDGIQRANGRMSRQIPRPAGETTTQVQSDLGQSMILRFEILVVKVPFLSLHGLQFKKLDGGTWQYKKMAENILALLKL